MREMYRKSYLFCAFIGLCVCLNAQVVALQTDFSNGVPLGWGQSPAQSLSNWALTSTGYGTLSSQVGNGFVVSHPSEDVASVKLITPRIDIGQLTSPVLSFWFAQLSENDQNDGFNVYYKTTPTSEWVLLQSHLEATPFWVHGSIDLFNIPETVVQFAFESTYGGGPGVALDEVYVGDMSDCSAPVNVQAFRITNSSVHLNCSASTEALQYDVKVSTRAMYDFSLQADVLDTTVFALPFTLNGLQPSTNYYVYMRSECTNGDSSYWSDMMMFTTLCASASIPYQEGFNDVLFPTCWSKLQLYFGDWSLSESSSLPNSMPEVTGAVKYEGDGSLKLHSYYMDDEDGVRGTKAWAATPEIGIGRIDSLQIHFKALSSQRGSVCYVGLMSDPMDVSTFVSVKSFETYVTNGWEDVCLSLQGATANGRYVAFMVDGSDGVESEFYIDSVFVEYLPVCSQPTLVKVPMIKNNQALVTWLSYGQSSHIKISTFPIVDFALTADVLDSVVSSDSVFVNGLNASTPYYVYLQGECGGSAQSQWVGATEFSTLCQSVLSFPYYENFDDDIVDDFPACWLRPVMNGSYPKVSAYQAQSNPNALWMNSEEGKPTYVISPCISSELNSLQVSFYLTSGLVPNCGALEVGVMSNAQDSTTFELVRRIEPMEMLSSRFEVPLMNVKLRGEGNHVAFRHVTKNSTSGNFWLDNVVIDSLPDCVAPQQIEHEVVSPKTVVLRWRVARDESEWVVKVSRGKLSDPATDLGTVYNDTLQIDSLVLNQLLTGVDYVCYFQSLHDGCSSSWMQYRFTIPCDGSVLELPYVESFTGYDMSQGNAEPACWSNPMGYAVIMSQYNHTSNVVNSGSLYMSPSYGIPKSIVALPSLTDSIATLKNVMLSFAYKGLSVGSGLIVGVMSNPNDVETFVALDTFLTTGNFIEVSDYTFEDYVGSGKYIAFMSQLGFASAYSNVVYLDDIRLELIPACRVVRGVSLTALSDSVVGVSWSETEIGNSWQLVIGEGQFDPDSVTPINVTMPYYRFQSLEPNHAYTIYVRKNCGTSDGFSLWSDALKVTTLKPLDEIPLMVDFETDSINARWSFANGGEVNAWVVGDQCYQQGTHAMYISSSASTTKNYEYSTSNQSYVYAYRSVKFTPGVYRISFDWKCMGEDPTDVARVALVDPIVELQAGNAYGMDNYNNDLPKSWHLDLADGELVDQAEWTRKESIFTVDSDAVYNLVFFWKNNSYFGTQPPVAIDSLMIESLNCSKVLTYEVQVTDSSAQISWENLLQLQEWHVKVVSGDGVDLSELDTLHADVLNDTVAMNSIVLNGLQAASPYVIYVQSVCSNGSSQEWTSAAFMTECASIKTLPFEAKFDDSEDLPACWPVSASTWMTPSISTSKNYSYLGQGSLCLSASNFGNPQYNVIATPAIDAVPMNELRMSFQLNGQSGNALEVGVMADANEASSFEPIDTIWVSLSDVWELKHVDFSKYNGSGRHVAFRVGGLLSYVNVNLDDIRIHDDRSCEQPYDLNVSRLSTNSANLSWNSTNSSADFNVVIASRAIDPNDTTLTDVDWINGVQNSYYMLTDLLESTTYYCYVQSDCGSVKNSYWSEPYVFTTLCQPISVPYYEDFQSVAEDSYDLPSCWSEKLVHTGHIVDNCYAQGVSVLSGDSLISAIQVKSVYEPVLVDGEKYLNSTVYMVSLPKFTVPVDQLSVRFKAGSDAFASVLKVGVSTDVSDISTFTAVDSIVLGSLLDNMASLNSYQGPDGFISFVVSGYDGLTTIGDVYVDTLKSCQAAIRLTVEDVTDSSAVVSWKPLLRSDSLWHFQLYIYNDDNIVPKIDTVIVGWQYALSGLTSNTRYFCRLIPGCLSGSIDSSYVKTLIFATNCISLNVPFVEDFSSVVLNMSTPICWERRRGYFNSIDGIVNYDAMTSNWNIDAAPQDSSEMINVTGDDVNDWLITPSIVLSGPAKLHFDAKLTELGGSNAPDAGWASYDDRFYIMVSTDGGASWDVNHRLTYGDSFADDDFDFYDVPSDFTHYELDLSDFAGSSIVVGFYAESTDDDVSSTLYLDNVSVLGVATRSLHGDACLGSGYYENGFIVDASELDSVGDYVFTDIRRDDEGDTAYVLTLSVHPSVLTRVESRICQGDVYQHYGFNEMTSGVYRQFLQTSMGCDSLVELTLLVVSDSIFEQDVIICDNSPIQLSSGEWLSVSGDYLDTVPSSLGCDSVVLLHLQVNKSYDLSDAVIISTQDLPFVYNDSVFNIGTPAGVYHLVFNDKSSEGCDSVTTLTLTVMDGSGCVENALSDIMMYPTMIDKGNEVHLISGSHSESLLDARIEIYSSLGELIGHYNALEWPLSLRCFDVSGLYVVRVVSGSEVLFSGKVLVK